MFLPTLCMLLAVMWGRKAVSCSTCLFCDLPQHISQGHNPYSLTFAVHNIYSVKMVLHNFADDLQHSLAASATVRPPSCLQHYTAAAQATHAHVFTVYALR